jgi:2-polyprenyl-3-methyl-5-hydroxy-6-metoxy-1,4-benzoquinol methylase
MPIRCDDGSSQEGAEGGLLSKQYWQARYESGQTGWDRGQPSPALTHWMNSGSLQPCRILVPGCGRGHEVVALCEAGFEVTAIDFAEAAVQAVAQTLLRRPSCVTIC